MHTYICTHTHTYKYISPWRVFCRHKGTRWCQKPRYRDPPACDSGKMPFPWSLGHCRTLSLCNALDPSSQTLQSSPYLHREGKMSHKKKDTKIHPKGHSDLFLPLNTLLSQTPPMSPLDPVVVCRSRYGCWVGPSPFALVEIDQSGPSRGHSIWPILRPACRP